METVTISATRAFVLTGAELLALAAIGIGLLAWHLTGRLRRRG